VRPSDVFEVELDDPVLGEKFNTATASALCRSRMNDQGAEPMPMNKPHLEFHKVDMKEGW